jgi:hypothetical protein
MIDEIEPRISLAQLAESTREDYSTFQVFTYLLEKADLSTGSWQDHPLWILKIVGSIGAGNLSAF